MKSLKIGKSISRRAKPQKLQDGGPPETLVCNFDFLCFQCVQGNVGVNAIAIMRGQASKRLDTMTLLALLSFLLVDFFVGELSCHVIHTYFDVCIMFGMV